jgi:hypothetical protein
MALSNVGTSTHDFDRSTGFEQALDSFESQADELNQAMAKTVAKTILQEGAWQNSRFIDAASVGRATH